MTPAERNRIKVQRILDDDANLKALRANIADGSYTLEIVLSEVIDDAQRDKLRIALTES